MRYIAEALGLNSWSQHNMLTFKTRKSKPSMVISRRSPLPPPLFPSELYPIHPIYPIYPSPPYSIRLRRESLYFFVPQLWPVRELTTFYLQCCHHEKCSLADNPFTPLVPSTSLTMVTLEPVSLVLRRRRNSASSNAWNGETDILYIHILYII